LIAVTITGIGGHDHRNTQLDALADDLLAPLSPNRVLQPTNISCAYVGRFAPSPSGPLHAGSLVAAMASYLDARAHGGRWVLRMEDLDAPRVAAGAAQVILAQLRALGMHWDGDVLWQSGRTAAYQRAWTRLQAGGLLYPCGCTRREIADSMPPGVMFDAERPYSGACRAGLAPGRTPRAWRVQMPSGVVTFVDRCLGPQAQDVARAVGDVIVRRADGVWAYQLAVVVDDADAGVTDVVRGADLLGSTARQIRLAQLLGLPVPRYMHVPLVMDAVTGLKLSKQNGALAIDIRDTRTALAALQDAWRHLGFAPVRVRDVQAFWPQAVTQWARSRAIWVKPGKLPRTERVPAAVDASWPAPSHS